MWTGNMHKKLPLSNIALNMNYEKRIADKKYCVCMCVCLCVCHETPIQHFALENIF